MNQYVFNTDKLLEDLIIQLFITPVNDIKAQGKAMKSCGAVKQNKLASRLAPLRIKRCLNSQTPF